MPDLVYAKSKKINKRIAMVILITLFLQSVGLFTVIGFDLATPVIGGFSILSMILFLGMPWIAWGLYRYRIG